MRAEACQQLGDDGWLTVYHHLSTLVEIVCHDLCVHTCMHACNTHLMSHELYGMTRLSAMTCVYIHTCTTHGCIIDTIRFVCIDKGKYGACETLIQIVCHDLRIMSCMETTHKERRHQWGDCACTWHVYRSCMDKPCLRDTTCEILVDRFCMHGTWLTATVSCMHHT